MRFRVRGRSLPKESGSASFVPGTSGGKSSGRVHRYDRRVGIGTRDTGSSISCHPLRVRAVTPANSFFVQRITVFGRSMEPLLS